HVGHRLFETKNRQFQLCQSRVKQRAGADAARLGALLKFLDLRVIPFHRDLVRLRSCSDGHQSQEARANARAKYRAVPSS
ncbi:MAG: hypothetical protein ACI89J_004705, partial [Hyphomicrobiaceae bacterium]